MYLKPAAITLRAVGLRHKLRLRMIQSEKYCGTLGNVVKIRNIK